MSKAIHNNGLVVNPSNLKYIKGIDNSDSDKLVQLSSSPVTSGKSIYNEGMIVNPSDMKYVKGIDLSGNDCLSNFPSGKINITNTNEIDVTNYATAQVVDPDLVPSNIKSGVNILGVTGNMIVPSGTLNITADGTYDVTNYAQVNVNITPSTPVTSASRLWYVKHQGDAEHWEDDYTFDRSGWMVIVQATEGPSGGCRFILGSSTYECYDDHAEAHVFYVNSGTNLKFIAGGYDGGSCKICYAGPGSYNIRDTACGIIQSGTVYRNNYGWDASSQSFQFNVFINNYFIYGFNTINI